MTVNILCTGDTQIGKAFGTLGASAGDFRNQLFETFKRVMNDAKEYDLVLVAGDVFDREGTPTSLIEAAADVFAACKTPTVVLAGNHDSLKSGIPQVLKAALVRRKADHVFVPLQREPLPFPKLGLTVYPVPLLNKGDISNQYAWIPERSTEDGLRVALMHGGLDTLPDGTIPADVASKKDLDLVVCGDQHGPSQGGEDASVLFNRETSIKRRLVYSMAPEAQHINQGFVGAYTNVALAENGEIVALTRTEVGELRFLNSTVTFNAETDLNLELEQALSPVADRPPNLTSIRLTLVGELTSEGADLLDIEIAKLKSIWPLCEVFNQTTVVQNGDDNTVQMDDPVLRTLLAKAHDVGLDHHILKRAIEFYRINKGRWV